MKKGNIRNLVVTSAAAFSFFSVHNEAKANTEHQVAKGESLWALGQTYGVSIDTIKKANSRQTNTIYAGESLTIPSSNSYTSADIDLLERVVEAEAKGEPYEGKVAVANVVLNRVDSPEFPNSITDVIKQKIPNGAYAFTPVQNGAIDAPASEESKRAVQEALVAKKRSTESLYFYNPDIATSDWIRTREIVQTIGNHVFAK
ncbi:cell wall hydrolase [Metabacillus iocasae]|uniref:N-acetylmuramoyl-L-alanine amidase n=1 Tax=Priestia iocasae TaxID=2291674 RepID=A0ABS2QZ14_9BACI|nr:cell wall hydrolase [Metabacillus iocasae]MBM7704726.1 N-acetylmuramoyl-L-alanine amidase [Metabacillus iocasae]